MARWTYRVAVLIVTAALTSACSARQTTATDGSASRERAAARNRTGSPVVIPGTHISGRGGTLLDALVGRVSTMRIERRDGRCPTITMRGQKTMIGNPDPRIYIDGVQMLDTCSLTQIRVAEVERVEVYPSGFTDRPRYHSHPNGVILVFLVGPEAVP